MQGIPYLTGFDIKCFRETADKIPSPNIHRTIRCLCYDGRTNGDLDLLRCPFPDHQVIHPLDILHNSGIHLISTDANRSAGDDTPQGNNGNFRCPTADINDHTTRRFLNRQPRTNGSGHWFLNEVRFSGTGLLCRINHGPFLHFRDPGRYADDNSWAHERPRIHRLTNKILQHRLRHIKIRDHTVLHRANRYNISRCTTDHTLCFLAHRQNFAVIALYCHYRWLTQHNTPPFNVNQSIRCPQINAHITRKSTKQAPHFCPKPLPKSTRFPCWWQLSHSCRIKTFMCAGIAVFLSLSQPKTSDPFKYIISVPMSK